MTSDDIQLRGFKGETASSIMDLIKNFFTLTRNIFLYIVLLSSPVK